MCSITPRRHPITQARVTFQEISTDVRAGGPSCQDGAAAGRVREQLDGWWWWWGGYGDGGLERFRCCLSDLASCGSVLVCGGRASISSHCCSLLFVPYCLQWQREPAIPSLPYWQRETYLPSVLCTRLRTSKIDGLFHLNVYESGALQKGLWSLGPSQACFRFIFSLSH